MSAIRSLLHASSAHGNKPTQLSQPSAQQPSSPLTACVMPSLHPDECKGVATPCGDSTYYPLAFRNGMEEGVPTTIIVVSVPTDTTVTYASVTVS
jgi:hypothetical protein